MGIKVALERAAAISYIYVFRRLFFHLLAYAKRWLYLYGMGRATGIPAACLEKRNTRDEAGC